MKALVITVLAFLIILFAIMAARANPVCAEKQSQIAKFKHEFGEVPLIHGINVSGVTAMMILANPKTRTWSLWEVGPNGLVCLKGSGTDLDTITDMGLPS